MAVQSALNKLIKGTDAILFQNKIIEVAGNLGIEPNVLTIFMHFESGLSASIKNALGYVGLIQFGDDAATDTGTTKGKLMSMTRTEQMVYVEKYFQLQFRRFGNKTDFVDLYLLINYPRVVNEGSCDPLTYTENARRNQPSLQDSDGFISKQSIYQNFKYRYDTLNVDTSVLGPGPNCAGVGIPTPDFVTNDANNTSSSVNPTGSNTVNIDQQFKKIENNIDNTEFDDSQISWGSRTRPDEESDFIGLKQFLLYLTTRFYPQNLVPFVELIPVYSVDSARKSVAFQDVITKQQVEIKTNIITSLLSASTGIGLGQNITDVTVTEQKIKNADLGFLENKTLLDGKRFDATANKLLDLSKKGGTDLFTADPFLEFSDAFNVPNAEGKAIQEQRGFGYKIFGTLTLNPPVQGDGLSKAGAIGLKSIEIESGSQVHHGMSLITVKLLDVQGNKFLDINSPWSFLLNSRPGMVGGDFYFRFGWQVRVPDPDRKDDDQAQRFWNHPGWKLFSALQGESDEQGDDSKTIKNYIKNIAQHCDGVITLTQSTSLQAMKTPGYRRDATTGSFSLDRNLNFLDYLTLTLINPELDINPEDGSIEATLFFRVNTAVANCLALLNGTGLPKTSNNETLYKLKTLVNNNNNPTLADFMIAFINDCKNYSLGSPNLSSINNGNNSIFFADYNVNDWLTVIGGAGKQSTFSVDPKNINLNITNDLLKDMNEADEKDNRLLIEWVNKVLNQNNIVPVSSADQGNNINLSTQTLSGGFVYVYDSEKETDQTQQVLTGKDLSLTDPTFGDFLNYTDADTSSDNFVGKRLLVQDDVFAFRFQGSLVESINIEKLESPNEATIQAQQNFAKEQGENADSTDVSTKSPDEISKQDQVSSFTTLNPTVTYKDKKRILNILYSTMLGLKVKCIAHPWLKLCRPAYVKGMGFWDGKYMVTKIKHSLDEGNKFTSEINAFRVLDDNENNTTIDDTNNQRESSMNNPNARKSTPIVSPVKKQPTTAFILNPKTTYEVADVFSFESKINNFITNTDYTPLRPEIEAFLKELHFSVQRRFRAFIRQFESTTTFKVKITSGYRTWAEQEVLKAQNPNNASPGRSMHNYGLACDLNVLDANGNIIAKKDTSSSVWEGLTIVSLARALGMTWGGTDFGEYHDRVHFGFDRNFDVAVLQYLAIQQFGSNVNNIQGNKIKFTGFSSGQYNYEQLNSASDASGISNNITFIGG